MISLVAAVTAPALGPALYWMLHPRPRAVRAVDGFVYVAVPALVAWQVLPHAWADRSLAMIVALVLGFMLPGAIERASHALAEQTDNLAIVVGISGIVLHAGLEGTGLVPTSGASDLPFALAVTVHRIPVGLVLWWLIRPRFGVMAAAAAVGSVMVATLAGYAVGAELLGDGHHAGFEVYQAFVSGSLVHVVFHQGRHDHEHHHDHGHEHAHRHEAHGHKHS
jgi:hypothetical protein